MQTCYNKWQDYQLCVCVCVCVCVCIQLTSVAWSCPTLCDPMDIACPSSLSITNSWSLLKLMSIESVMPSNHLILCCLLLLLPSVFPSIRIFVRESILHIRGPKYWSFSFSMSPSSQYSGLISFEIDWFDLLPFQAILKSFLQYHSSKASSGGQPSLGTNSHICTWLLEKP